MNIASKREQHEFKLRRTESEVHYNVCNNKSFVNGFSYKAEQQNKLGRYFPYYGVRFKKYNKRVLVFGATSLRTSSHRSFYSSKSLQVDRQASRGIYFIDSKVSDFCGRGLVQSWKVPDHTKIEEFRNRLSAKTHKLVGDYFLKYAVEAGFGDASWMDIDSTVQEANMAYPADCNILKKLALKTKKVVEFLRSKNIRGFKGIDIDIKSICKKAQEYFFLAKNSSIEVKRKIFGDYFSKVKTELNESIKAIETLPEIIKTQLPWNIAEAVSIIQEKAWRYLLDVAHFTRTHTIKPGKILSLQLSAVACISKGKVDKKHEFGRLVQFGRIGGNFLIPLSTEVKMEDKQSIVPMVANHAQIFGQGCLQGIGTDKGYYSHNNTAIIGINTDGLQRPASVKTRPPDEVAQPLRDRRAGIEPLIGHLKSFGLKKSKMKSDRATHASVYTCTMGYNIHQILRHQEGKFKAA